MNDNKFQRFGDITDQLLKMVEQVGSNTHLQKEVDEFQSYHDFIMKRLHTQKMNVGEDIVIITFL